MKIKSKKQIAEQLELLRLMRLAIPEYSGFGDNNHKHIDSQMGALQNVLDVPKSKEELEARLEAAWDVVDPDVGSSPFTDAYSWLLDEIEDLVEADDIWVKRGMALDKAKAKAG